MTTSYQISMTQGGIPVRCKCSQYDKTLREISLKLVRGDGGTYKPPTGAVAIITGTKPDNKGFTYELEIESRSINPTVDVPLTEQMTCVAGEVPCQIAISLDGGVEHSARFILDVQPAALNENADVSASEYASIGQAAAEAAANRAAAQTAAQQAQTAAQQAQTSATAAAEDATTATNAATTAQTAATNAEASATTATGAATTATGAAETATGAAQSAASSAADAEAAEQNAANAAASAQAAADMVSPAMEAGVEYETTKLWGGQTVYVKRISMGQLPNVATTMQVPIGVTGDKVISLSGIAHGTSNNSAMPFPIIRADGIAARLYIANSAVAIATLQDMSSFTAEVVIEYIKD